MVLALPSCATGPEAVLTTRSRRWAVRLAADAARPWRCAAPPPIWPGASSPPPTSAPADGPRPPRMRSWRITRPPLRSPTRTCASSAAPTSRRARRPSCSTATTRTRCLPRCWTARSPVSPWRAWARLLGAGMVGISRIQSKPWHGSRSRREARAAGQGVPDMLGTSPTPARVSVDSTGARRDQEQRLDQRECRRRPPRLSLLLLWQARRATVTPDISIRYIRCRVPLTHSHRALAYRPAMQDIRTHTQPGGERNESTFCPAGAGHPWPTS